MGYYSGPGGFGRINNIFLNVCIGVVATLAVVLSLQSMGLMPLTPATFAQFFVTSFVVGYAWGDILNPAGIAAKVAGKTTGIVNYVITCLVIGLIMGAVVLFFCVFIGNFATGGWEAVGGAFMLCIPVVWIAVIVLLIIVMRPLMMVSAKLSGFDPTGAMASAGDVTPSDSMPSADDGALAE